MGLPQSPHCTSPEPLPLRIHPQCSRKRVPLSKNVPLVTSFTGLPDGGDQLGFYLRREQRQGYQNQYPYAGALGLVPLGHHVSRRGQALFQDLGMGVEIPTAGPDTEVVGQGQTSHDLGAAYQTRTTMTRKAAAASLSIHSPRDTEDNRWREGRRQTKDTRGQPLPCIVCSGQYGRGLPSSSLYTLSLLTPRPP